MHSHARADVTKGVDLAEAMLHSSSLEARDLQYLVAVGKYRSRKYLDARRILKEVLEVGKVARTSRGGGGGWEGASDCASVPPCLRDCFVRACWRGRPWEGQ